MNKIIIFLKSLAFSCLFLGFLITILFPLITICLFLPAKYMKIICRFWAKGSIFILKYTAGITYKIEGLNNINNSQTCIYVSKHQSTFETLILYVYLNMPVFIVKKEFLYIPFIGWAMKKVDFITVDRSKGKEAVLHLANSVKNLEKTKRSIVIFAEGTRVPFGKVGKYKGGAYNIWENTGRTLNIIPVAVNTGKYWGKKQFMKEKGEMIISFLPAIQFNQETTKNDFISKVQEVIETKQKEFK